MRYILAALAIYAIVTLLVLPLGEAVAESMGTIATSLTTGR